MEENLKNKLGFWSFFVIVLFLAIGGYFLTDYLLNSPKEEEKVTIVNYKIEKDKEYIYYENETVISEDAEISTNDVVINLNTQSVLNESLNKENKLYKNNIELISEHDILTEEIINYNYDDIYALTFRKYEDYEYGNLISLVVKDYNYTCFDSVTFSKVKAYVFDTSTGEVIKEEDLLNKYNLNMDSVKEKVKEYLLSIQSVVDEVEVIKIDDTLNDFTNYAFYINDYGKLSISFLVKTTQVDYNEVMEVN